MKINDLLERIDSLSLKMEKSINMQNGLKILDSRYITCISSRIL